MAKQLHHFVPRFYLRRFVDRRQKKHELVWAYERGKQEPELRSLDHIAARNNYYTIDLGNGRKHQGIENMFSIVEGAAASILEKLATGQHQLSSEDREIFSAFLAFGWSRVPKFRDEVEESAAVLLNDYAQNLARDPYNFARTVAEVEGKTGAKLGGRDAPSNSGEAYRGRGSSRAESSNNAPKFPVPSGDDIRNEVVFS